jgi:polyisoprenoid-binding protein YceI
MCANTGINVQREPALGVLSVRSLAAAALIAAAACSGVKPAAERPPAPSVSTPAEGALYRLVPEQSELRVLVYRDGPLAALGHNHVISSGDLSGRVILADRLADSFVELYVPVAGLQVDRPSLRLEEGDDFPGELDQESIAGTRANMLGEGVLDAAQFPQIRMVSRAIAGTLPELAFDMTVEFRGGRYSLQVPAQVTATTAQLSASGQFELRQTDLGMEPFSALLGALSVRDKLLVKFQLTATSDAEN